ncbi:hypothetical protein Sjap_002508 [Stephania japonica]|uniref:Uncharacterized protein n=1 Tax=Stephania japonica TaxID=461633 RepID=A0AAP0KNK8_9MAGN
MSVLIFIHFINHHQHQTLERGGDLGKVSPLPLETWWVFFIVEKQVLSCENYPGKWIPSFVIRSGKGMFGNEFHPSFSICQRLP